MPNRKQFKTHKEYIKWYRDYRKKNQEKLRIYNKYYTRIWRFTTKREADRLYQKKFPEIIKSHYLVAQAIKKGILKRGKCEICSIPKTEGHHDDYGKPLKVRWLCPSHHKRLHAKKTKKNE